MTPREVGARDEEVGDLVAPVDEAEHPDPGELLAQRLDQHHREVAEPGDRAGDVAEQHQLGAARARPAVHQVASGRRRWTSSGAGCGACRSAPRRARRRRAASRVARWRASGRDAAAQVGELSAPAERKSTCSACAGTPVLRDPPRARGSPRLRRRVSSLHHRAGTRRCAARGLAARDLLGEAGRRAPRAASRRLGEDPREQRLGAHLVAAPGRPRTSRGPPPVLPAGPPLTARPLPWPTPARRARRHGAGELGERRGVAVGEQLGEQVAQRVDVDRRRPRRRAASTSPSAGALPEREPQVEQRVEGLALPGAAQQRGGEPLAQLARGRSRSSSAMHRGGVDGLPRPDGDAVAAQRVDEVDEVGGQTVRRDGVRRRSAHQLSRSSRGRLHQVGVVLEDDAEGRRARRRRRRCRGRAPARCGAQSMVSATDGALRSSSPRSTPTMRTSCSASASGSCGTRLATMRALELGVGEVEVQEQAAPLEGLGELAGGVGGQQRERALGGDDGAELGDGDLEVAEHLEEQALHLDVGLVGLVDEQHRGLVAPDGGEQRAGEQELLGEDVVAGRRPRPRRWLALMRSSCLAWFHS